MADEAGTTRHSTPTVRRGVKQFPDSGNETPRLVQLLGASHPVPASGPREKRIAAIAEAQRGRAARRQLLSAGISSSAIGRMIDRGRLHPVHPGVYTVGHDAPVPLGDETAALLACGEHAVLSHHSAAALWGLIPEGDGSIHVTIRDRHGPRPDGVTVHRTNSLTRGEVRIVEDLPVTSPARTLTDIASEVDDRTFERAVNEALVQRLVSERELGKAAAARRGRPGGRTLAALLGRQREPSITRSEAERRLRGLLRAAQLPEPSANARVHGFEVDFYWPQLGVVVEVQGYKFHSGRAAFERDTRKAAKLAAAGLTVLYVTWRQMEEEPYAVVARVAQALAWAESRRAA